MSLEWAVLIDCRVVGTQFAFLDAVEAFAWAATLDRSVCTFAVHGLVFACEVAYFSAMATSFEIGFAGTGVHSVREEVAPRALAQWAGVGGDPDCYPFAIDACNLFG